MPLEIDVERLWEQIIRLIDEERVIPVIGQELLTLKMEGRPIHLYAFLAQRLARRLDLPGDPANYPSLNQVACQYLANGGDIADIYPDIVSVMPTPADLALPESLRKLAAIRPFKLFVTTTFDPLMARALDEERFGGAAKTEIIAYAPERNQDLPCEIARLERPTVFHLFGRISAAPEYAVTDEDILEFMHALQSKERRPARLFDELGRQNLLVIGCAFSDWLKRFFLRLSKGERLSVSRKIDFLCDEYTQDDSGLVFFLQHFSKRTRVFPGSAIEFVDELHRRWTESHPAVAVPKEAPALRPGTGANMTHGAVFLSYASEDRAAVEIMTHALEAAGIDAWFDRRELHLGDAFEAKILANIENCSVFIPVISQSTLTENPRFFRKEWRQAEQVALQMPPNRRFIAPVAIDDTAVTAEALPKGFRDLHWMRLPGGETTSEFVAEIVKLFRAYQKSGANTA